MNPQKRAALNEACEVGGAVLHVEQTIRGWPPAERVKRFAALQDEVRQKADIPGHWKLLWLATITLAMVRVVTSPGFVAEAAEREEAEAALNNLLNRRNGD